MASKPNITPEEKLLSVIQKDGRAEVSAQPAQATSEKVAPSSPDQPSSAISSAATGSRYVSMAARFFGLVTVLLLAGSGYELVRAVPVAEALPPPPNGDFLRADGDAVSLPAFDEALRMFVARRITGTAPDGSRRDPESLLPTMRNWTVLLRDHFRLMGVSTVQRSSVEGVPRRVQEAIVLDTRTDSLYFLSPGKSLVIDDNPVTVKHVLPDAVVFEDDDFEVTFHKKGAGE